MVYNYLNELYSETDNPIGDISYGGDFRKGVVGTGICTNSVQKLGGRGLQAQKAIPVLTLQSLQQRLLIGGKLCRVCFAVGVDFQYTCTGIGGKKCRKRLL